MSEKPQMSENGPRQRTGRRTGGSGIGAPGAPGTSGEAGTSRAPGTSGEAGAAAGPRRMGAASAVVVVGNGPVGQTTALLLTRWGIPVVLLDGRPERDPIGSKAICQQRDVLDVWEAVGAGGRIAGEGVTWTTARTFYREHELFAYTLPDPGRSAFPPFVNISQTRVEEILDERIADQPLIDVRWGHRVTGIDQDDTAVVLTCRTPHGRVQVAAGYAVVCTGAHCHQVRAMLGVGFDGCSFDDRFLICDIRADLPGWANERRFHFDPVWNPGRQVLIHPCPGSTFRIDWQVPGDFDLAAEESSGALDRRIRAIIGADADYEIRWKSVYRFHARSVDRMRVGRVLLAGDCAHLVAPFGARGLNSGVADAENAAWKLAYVRYGWADGGDGLLESYHHERHAAALENLQVTTQTMDFLVPHGEEQWRHRLDVLTRAAADPAVAAAQVDSGRLSEPFWYVDSPLTTPAAGRTFAGRPPRGTVPAAGPGIIVPDVPIADPETGATRFREITRDGFLLLAADGVDLGGLRRAAAGAGSGPVRAVRLADIDLTGALADALSSRPGEVWIIRPDAHVAAVLTSPGDTEVTSALRRALGQDPRDRDHDRDRTRARTHAEHTRKAVDDGVLPTGR